jgi:uncharacterized protein YcbK (DUF882 family)
MDDDFLKRLDKARELAGVPFVITSGFRCPKHNKEVGGKPNSAHLRGLAADIAVADNETRYQIIYGLIKAGFKRIGIGKGFIHVDGDVVTKPFPRVWLY